MNAASVSTVVAVVLGATGLAFAYTLTAQCLSQPLFPFQPDNLAWTRSWLWTT
jgi:hypothetical protein